jgi:hypothetical protein
MVKALFDTNILVDFLLNVPAARQEFARYEKPAISVMTWIEVMVGATPEEQPEMRRFLGRFEQIALDPAVSEEAVRLRRAHRLKLPDAIIWASARQTGRLLVTRNTKDFPPDDPGVREPYRL